MIDVPPNQRVDRGSRAFAECKRTVNFTSCGNPGVVARVL